MTPLISAIRATLDKRARYRQTLSELRSLPIDVRLDLDIAGIEEDVAHRAVYG